MSLRAAPLASTLLALALVSTACEPGDDDSGEISPTAPQILAFDVDVDRMNVNATRDVVATLGFSDADGNLDRVSLRLLQPDGAVFDEGVAPVDTQAQVSGELTLNFTLTPPTEGTWTVEATALDADDQASAAATDTLIVEAPTGSPPVITEMFIDVDRLNIDTSREVTATVRFRDEDGDLDALELRLLGPDGAVVDELESEVAASEVSGELTLEFTVSPEVEGTWTVEITAVDAEAARSAPSTDTFTVVGFSDGQDACAATGLDCEGQGFCYNVEVSTCEYLGDRGIDFDVCDTIEDTRVVPVCVSSTTDPEAEFVNDSNRCQFVQYWSNPTDFPMDCRCPEAAMTDRCRRPYDLPGTTSFSSGPRMRELASTIRAWRGTVVGREWYLPMAWSISSAQNQSVIFGINLDTGDRRLVTGSYQDPALGITEVGSGDPLLQVMDIKMGADNMLYAVGAASDIASPKLWRIDPNTGARTLIFDEATADASALCPNFSTLPGRRTVQMTPEGWAMDAQGRFYFSMVNMPGPSIVRMTITESGTSCAYLTRVSDCPTCSDRTNVGTGYSDIQFDMRAFEIVGDTLYTVSDTKLIAVDLNTGNRRLISNGKTTGGLGAGPVNAEALGDRWTTWDPYRNVLWTVGVLGGSQAVAVDPTNGNRYTWPCWHPTLGLIATCNNTGRALVPGPLGFGGMIIDPQPPHDLYFAHDLMSVVKYDPRTGNAYTFSL